MRYPLFENDQVRVWRTVVSRNEPLAFHRHDTNRVVVPLRDVRLKRVVEGSKSEDIHFAFGQAYWEPIDPPGEMHELHAEVNTSDEPMEVVVVELKR